MNSSNCELTCRQCKSVLLTRVGDLVHFKGSLPPIFYGDSLSFAGRCRTCGLGYRYSYTMQKEKTLDNNVSVTLL